MLQLRKRKKGKGWKQRNFHFDRSCFFFLARLQFGLVCSRQMRSYNVRGAAENRLVRGTEQR